MMEYRTYKTTAGVWSEIIDKHRDELKLFSSFTDMGGRFSGDPSKGKAMTEWALPGSPIPLIGAETTWESNPDTPHDRKNEKHTYWLCYPEQETA